MTGKNAVSWLLSRESLLKSTSSNPTRIFLNNGLLTTRFDSPKDKVTCYENIATHLDCRQFAQTVLARRAWETVVPWKLQNEELIEGKKMLWVCRCLINCVQVLILSAMANKRANTLSRRLLSTLAAWILRNVKSLKFVIAMTRAYRRLSVRWRAKSPFCWRCQIPTSTHQATY